MGNGRTRVLLASANKEVLQLLSLAAKDEPYVAIVAEAGDALETASLAASLRPDVVIVDAELPHVAPTDSLRLSRIGGLDTAINVCQELPGAAVVVLNRWREAAALRKDDGSSEIFLQGQSDQGSRMIALEGLDRGPRESNRLIFAGLSCNANSKARRRVMDISFSTIPIALLGILASLGIMLLVVQPAAGLALGLLAGLALFVSLGVRAVAAKWPKRRLIIGENAGAATEEAEKMEALNYVSEESPERLSRI